MTIFDKLWNWDLETWANVLEVFGFIISVITLIVSIFVTSKLNKIRRQYNFEKTIGKKIKAIKINASKLNVLLDDYDNNFEEIKLNLGLLLSEIKFVKKKVDFREKINLIRITLRINRMLKKRYLKTNETHIFLHLPIFFRTLFIIKYDDLFDIYSKTIFLINDLENINLNYNNKI